MIKKTPNKDEWCAISETKKNNDGSSKKFGCYPSRKQAENRLKQVEYFKHQSSVSVFASIENEDEEFKAFVAYIENGSITAGFMDSIKDKISKIKEFAALTGKSYNSIIGIFKNKEIFSFFNRFDWNLKAIISAIKEAAIFMDKLLSQIAKTIHNNKKIKRISDITDETVKSVDAFLSKNSLLKHTGGVLLASIILYISINGVYAGSIADFDMSDVLLALSGKLTFYDVFSGENGIKLLISLALGLTPISLSYGVWSNVPKAAVTLFNFIKKWD